MKAEITARLIEELSLNAWPALHTLAYDGWLLRFSAGYTKRANSINPLYPSTEILEAKIPACEILYARQHGLDVVFKLTHDSQPPELDATLDARGYRRIDETGVLTLGLATIPPEDPAPIELYVSLSSKLTRHWINAYIQLSGIAEHYVPPMEKMLGGIIAGQTCFASLTREGKIVAVGFGVLERGYLGLFDIVVAEPLRGKGIGTLLMGHLFRWGKTAGADTAYLQVVKSNQPALRLYKKLGFAEQYVYWYRVKSAAETGCGK
jgi:GNAT superfamily N-acetyltransferase